MDNLDDLRNKLAQQAESKPEKTKRRYTVSEERRKELTDRMKLGTEHRKKLDEKRQESIARKREEKEELKRELEEYRKEQMKAKIDMQIEAPTKKHKGPKAEGIKSKLAELTERLEKAPERDTQAISGLMEQISKLEQKIASMSVKQEPIVERVVERIIEKPAPVAVAPEQPAPVVEKKPRFYSPDMIKAPNSRRPYDPFGIY